MASNKRSIDELSDVGNAEENSDIKISVDESIAEQNFQQGLLSEVDMGISEYISHHSAIFGIFKQRCFYNSFSTFCVVLFHISVLILRSQCCKNLVFERLVFCFKFERCGYRFMCCNALLQHLSYISYSSWDNPTLNYV